MRWIYAGLLAVTAGVTVAQAQVTYPPTVTASDVTAAITAATPNPCSTPLPDTYTGSAGSASPCMPRQDATRPTQVQSGTTATDSTGNFSGTFAVPFGSAPSYVHAEINSLTNPFICQIGSATATGYTGRCFAVASTTLPGTLLALSGLVVSPITPTTAGQVVKVIARQ